MCIVSALKSKQNQRSIRLGPLRDAFTKINLSSEENGKKTGKKDSHVNFDDRSAERLTKQERICGSSSEPLCPITQPSSLNSSSQQPQCSQGHLEKLLSQLGAGTGW